MPSRANDRTVYRLAVVSALLSGATLILLLALTVVGTVWASGRKTVEAADVDRSVAAERAAREESAKQLTERISQLENRNADLLAWVVTTREKMIKEGFQAPQLPDSIEGGQK